jgi:hypothetical protein
MIITQTLLDIKITNAQCCAAEKAETFYLLKKAGDMSWIQTKNEAMYLIIAVQLLGDYDITSDCLTEDEICTIIKNIDTLCSACGCK